jgi:hypothetical protein
MRHISVEPPPFFHRGPSPLMRLAWRPVLTPRPVPLRPWVFGAKAAAVAHSFGCEHHELIFSPDAREVVLKMAAQFDEPFADSSCLANYLVCRHARQSVTVALSGVGGDELFGGYPRHLGARLLGALETEWEVALGIDPHQMIRDVNDRPIAILPESARPIKELVG